MNHFEAKDAIAVEGNQCVSADFYRVREKGVMALGLRDEPILILVDVVNHGSADSKTMLNIALEAGYIKQLEKDGYVYYDVVDIKDTYAPYQFRSHIAMQIAYPNLYWEYYGEEHVWDYSHPKMDALLTLTFSCLTNKLHPSDYFGEHEITSDKKKVGRPTTVVKKKVNPDGTSYTRWVAACQKRKQDIASAWTLVLEAMERRKSAVGESGAWLTRRSEAVHKNANEQLQHLETQAELIREGRDKDIAELDDEYLRRLAAFRQPIKDARVEHSRIKAIDKPLRKDFA